MKINGGWSLPSLGRGADYAAFCVHNCVDSCGNTVVCRIKPEYWMKVTENGELFMCKSVSDSPTDGFFEEALDMWLEIESQV